MQERCQEGKKMFIELKKFFLAKYLHYKPFPPFPLFLPKNPLYFNKINIGFALWRNVKSSKRAWLGTAVAEARGVWSSSL